MDTQKLWALDSGASSSMTFDKSIFINYQQPPLKSVTTAGGHTLNVAGIVTIRLNVLVEGVSHSVDIPDILLIPHMSYQLLSETNPNPLYLSDFPPLKVDTANAGRGVTSALTLADLLVRTWWDA